jgi:hypothetical protein
MMMGTDDDGDGDAERLLVCVGPIPPDGTEPGCIEVMNGRGVAGNPPFGVPGIDPNEPVWNWEANNPDAHGQVAGRLALSGRSPGFRGVVLR